MTSQNTESSILFKRKIVDPNKTGTKTNKKEIN